MKPIRPYEIVLVDFSRKDMFYEWRKRNMPPPNPYDYYDPIWDEYDQYDEYWDEEAYWEDMEAYYD